jgi:glycerol-3-phosphate dehydrogenase
VHEWKVEVINLMASKLGWTREQKELYRQELEKHLHDAVVPVDEEDDTALAQ